MLRARRRPVWGKKKRSRRRWECCWLGWRSMGCRGLSIPTGERVQAQGDGRRAVARRRSGHAVWAHVSQAGNSHDCCPFAAGEGRVERNHGIHQDRLIKKLRRKGIDNYEVANQYLKNEYLPQHNRLSQAEAERSRTTPDFSVM